MFTPGVKIYAAPREMAAKCPRLRWRASLAPRPHDDPGSPVSRAGATGERSGIVLPVTIDNLVSGLLGAMIGLVGADRDLDSG
jgi:hypothetical protein